MRNPFEKLKKKSSGSFVAAKPNRSVSFLIPFFIRSILGVFLFIKYRNPVLFLLCGLYGLLLSILLSEESKEQNPKKSPAEIEVHKRFYQLFFLYSAMENSYLKGFRMAVGNSPISVLRDDLNDFLDKDRKGVIPLKCTNSLSELNLIRAIKERRNESYEYSYRDLQSLRVQFNRAFPVKSEKRIPVFIIPSILSIAFLFGLLYVFSLPV